MTIAIADSDVISSLQVYEAAQAFPKGDNRRLLIIPAILDANGPMLINDLHKLTGYNRRSLYVYIEKLKEEFSLCIEPIEEGSNVLTVSDWGPILRKSGLKTLLTISE